MNQHFKKINLAAIVLLCTCISQNAMSQFTYLGISSEYALTTYNFYISDNTRNHQFKMGFDLLFRPLRNFGIGVNISSPLAQSNSFTFQNANITEEYGSFYQFSNRYEPQKINYEIKHSRSITVFGRVFFETYLNSFIDLGLSHFYIDESFQFSRKAVAAEYYSSGNLLRPAVQSHYIDFNYSHRAMAPILGFGFQPHVSKNVYVNFTFNTTILPFDPVPSFKYKISYRDHYNDSYEYVFIESQARKTKVTVSTMLRVGFYL